MRWKIKEDGNKEQIAQLKKELAIPEVIAKLLVERVPQLLLTEVPNEVYGRATPDAIAFMYPGRGDHPYSVAIYLGILRQLSHKIDINSVARVASFLGGPKDPSKDY